MERHLSDITLTRRHVLAFSAASAGAATVGAAPARPAADAPYRDAGLPIEARVQDLLARMTLEEKIAQLRVMWIGKFGILDADGSFSPTKARSPLANGLGQISRPADTMGTQAFRTGRHIDMERSVPLVNAVQRYMAEETRLGIPVMFHDETAHGLAARDATIFPAAPALASTWDPALIEQVFTVVAREARLRGNTIGLCPVLDLMRDPRFGRADEMFSEDPLLTARMGIAAVHGLQGRARPLGPDRIFATLKHFIHGSPQGGLNVAPADMSERTLRETYLAPFAETIRSADPAWIMASYNEVNGLPAHANAELLRATGRERLGFTGAYMSDYSGIKNLVTHHHVAEDEKAAAILALNAGVDVDFSDDNTFSTLAASVREGRVDQGLIDTATARVLAQKFEAGLFEDPYIDLGRARRQTNTAGDIALAREVARKAIILLKNDGVLPLEPEGPLRLAVIGPNAVEPLFGGYSGENARAVGVLAGLRANAPAAVTIDYAEGVAITLPDANGRHLPRSKLETPPEAESRGRIAEAVGVAERCDVILLVLGDNPQVTREATQPSEPGDRSTLSLFGLQDALVEAMLVLGKPVVVLLLNGRPLAVPRLAETANALLEGWYLGQEGGNAVADILFGRTSPGGKLAVSLPRDVGQLPIFYNRHPSAGENRWIEGERAPLYPFGHGLSYTRFEMSEPRVSRPELAMGESLTVVVEVFNAGERSGDEVVQVYLRDLVSSAPRPILELKAFSRVTLAPGERRSVSLNLAPDAFAFWDADMRWAAEPGVFRIFAGPDSGSLKSVDITLGPPATPSSTGPIRPDDPAA